MARIWSKRRTVDPFSVVHGLLRSQVGVVASAVASAKQQNFSSIVILDTVSLSVSQTNTLPGGGKERVHTSLFVVHSKRIIASKRTTDKEKKSY